MSAIFRYAWIALVLIVAEKACAAGKVEALVATDGRIKVVGNDGKRIGTFSAGLYEKGWRGGRRIPVMKQSGGSKRFKLRTPSGAIIEGSSIVKSTDKGLSALFTFTPKSNVELNSLFVSLDSPIHALANGTWKTEAAEGIFPKAFKEVMLNASTSKTLRLELPGSKTALDFRFLKGEHVLLQDNRKWGSSFSLRLSAAGGEGPKGMSFKKGRRYVVSFEVDTPNGMSVSHDGPVTIEAGAEWIPLKLDLEIEPNSALDFSSLGFHDAPAGKHGRVIARPDGRFAFEKNPDTPRRFYGVNFCFSAHYIPHEQSDRLADRLLRLGYNAVRVHHHERELVSGLDIKKDKMDQLDYLLAAFAKRGLYISTDLFVSRPVRFEDIGRGTGSIPMQQFKILIPVHEGAWKNWQAFAKTFLTHVNPYRELSYAQDPALAWLCMINEGNYGNFYGDLRKIPEWTAAWNRWLVKRYKDRAGVARAWDKELDTAEDPAKGTVSLPDNLWGATTPRVCDTSAFLSETERETFLRMKAFVKDELGCKALLTNANGWTALTTDQYARTSYDYVDEHFYIDHPHFIDRKWRLPSRSPNSSPVASGAKGGRDRAFTRLFGKPFTISEYNYSCPGRYRGVGGILTGALGALQDWDGIWRFAYSHNREKLFRPGGMDYFNMVSDPLGQASERAALCLYLRGDMKPATRTLALVVTETDARRPKAARRVAPNWHWTAWITKVGTAVPGNPGVALPYSASIPVGWQTAVAEYKGSAIPAKGPAYSLKTEDILPILRKIGIPAQNKSSPDNRLLESETGELLLDGPQDIMILNTARTAGGFAPAGKNFSAEKGGVRVKVIEHAATVWISTLDENPIASSKRLLVTHLTDLQNTGIRYAERAKQTLLAWGSTPHLVRAGKAEVSIKLNDAAKATVFALTTAGKRTKTIPAQARDGLLTFMADVKSSDDSEGARMLYEVVVGK